MTNIIRREFNYFKTLSPYLWRAIQVSTLALVGGAIIAFPSSEYTFYGVTAGAGLFLVSLFLSASNSEALDHNPELKKTISASCQELHALHKELLEIKADIKDGPHSAQLLRLENHLSEIEQTLETKLK